MLARKHEGNVKDAGHSYGGMGPQSDVSQTKAAHGE